MTVDQNLSPMQQPESSKIIVSSSMIRNDRGMTLIEIMIVIAIIAGLMAALGTGAVRFLNNSKIDTAKIQMKEIGKALEAFNLSCNSYPTTDQGLKALVASPGSDACANWGPEAYIKKEPKDPWGKSFVYESDGSTFELKSYGRNKQPGGEGYDKDIAYSELE
jgi:general secretion pathway protein G